MQVDFAVPGDHKLESTRETLTRGSILLGRSRTASVSLAGSKQFICIRQRQAATGLLRAASAHVTEAG
jgi:hypothetical protein